jgi:DNA-binding MarR family transcriptional regulator
VKLLTQETNSPLSIDDEVSSLIQDVVPLIMTHLRHEMRLSRRPTLSVPQLRTLVFLYRSPNASLSQVADYVGLKLPSMSKMINSLVVRKLVIRRASSKDRRSISLKLSDIGLKELMRSRSHTKEWLTQTLAVLTAEQKAEIIKTLKTLHSLFP